MTDKSVDEYEKIVASHNEECDFNTTIYEPEHKCNKFLLKKELTERNNIDEKAITYPTLDDPNFSLKIARKHEFNDSQYDGDIYDAEERSNLLANMSFELSPHQLFVKNFLSSQTPYNSLLLFHGLGTGKTCSAIGICEEHRDYIKQTNNAKKILIIASPTVQDNFKLQLFNEEAMENVNGQWRMNTCIGSKLINEVNPTKTKNISKEKMVTKINSLISSAYQFMGYRELANYIEKKQGVNVDSKKMSVKDQIARMKRNLKMEFDDRLICIDEVHNIRSSNDSENKVISNQLSFLVESASNMRLLFLSGTPMFNNYKEIIWLLNIMNTNDRRGLIRTSDIFDSEGKFRQDNNKEEYGKDLLIRKATGYISFVRGENPYTFPYRIYPDIFSKENTFNFIQVPTVSVNGERVVENEVDTITKSSLYITSIDNYQESVYKNIIKYKKNSNTVDDNNDVQENKKRKETIDSKLNYTRLQDPIQCLNIAFPLNILPGDIDILTSVEEAFQRGTVQVKDAVGTQGLKNTMNYIDSRTAENTKKGDFEYKEWVQKSEHANMFAPQNIGKYSSKMKNVCDCIEKTKGVILVYSQYLDGALIPMALALEEMGITRYGSRSKSLFKKPPTKSIGRYIMITGDRRLSPNNIEEIVAVTKDENKNGDNIRVVLVSMAGSEGVDLKFIRQVHILEPWFNISRLEQIIGRAVRNNSHKLLDYKERNVQIYMYGTKLSDENQEAADVSVYRSAEAKAIQIGRVTRVLKEVSVDCFLNHSQVNFSVDKMNQKVKQILPDGTEIAEYEIGDRSYTMSTDFMQDGEYKCYNTLGVTNIENIEIDNTTYDEKFIMLNTDKIVHKIKELYKEKFFYVKDDLFSRINYPKQYPVTQIYSALTMLIDNESDYLVDMYGRNGRLVNIGDYYLFQPVELMNPQLSLFERTTPMHYKNESVKIKMEIPSVLKDELLKSNVQSEKATIKENDNSVEETMNILQDMYDMYAPALKIFNSDVSISAKDPLYNHVGRVMRQLKITNFSDGGDFNEEILSSLLISMLVSHLCDHLKIRDKITLFHGLNSSAELSFHDTEFLKLVNKYFIDKQMTITNSINQIFNAIIFYDPNIKNKENKAIHYVKYENSSWKIAETEDKKDINTYLNNNVRNIDKTTISNVFGFMGYGQTSNSDVAFKLKDNTNTRSTGSKCTEMSSKNKKVEVLFSILKLGYQGDAVNDENIEEKINTLKTAGNTFGMKEICIFTEFVVRYYESINRNGKRWFFDYEIQNILQEILKTV